MSLNLANLQETAASDSKVTRAVPHYTTDLEPVAACSVPAESVRADAVLRKLVNLSAIFVLAALATAFFIYYSWHWGRLSSRIPTYDDVGYFQDALQRLNLMRERGFWSIIPLHYQMPVHSPWSVYAAMASYCIFGKTLWAPYAMNALVLFLALVQIDSIARSCSWWARWGLMLTFLTLPMATTMVADFRPDAFCALLTAIGLRLLAETRLSALSRGRVVGVGLVWAAALWVKPTLFAQTSIFYVGVLGLSCLRDWWTATVPRKSLCLKSLAVMAIAGLAAFPHLGLELPYYFNYMWINTFGSNRDLWTLKISLRDHLLYYLAGPAGSFTFGKAVIYMSGAIAATLALAWRRRQKDLLHVLAAMLCCVVLCWLPPTLNQVKSAFFGMTFAVLFIFTAIRVLSAWLSNEWQMPRRLSLAIGCVMLLAITAQSKTLRASTYRPPGSRDLSPVIRDVHENVREYLQQRPDSLVMMPTVGALNANVLAYYLELEGLKVPPYACDYISGDINVYLKCLDRADIVIIPEVGCSRLLYPEFPYAQLHAELIERIAGDQHFRLAASIPHGDDSHVRIYVRGSSF